MKIVSESEVNRAMKRLLCISKCTQDRAFALQSDISGSCQGYSEGDSAMGASAMGRTALEESWTWHWVRSTLVEWISVPDSRGSKGAAHRAVMWQARVIAVKLCASFSRTMACSLLAG